MNRIRLVTLMSLPMVLGMTALAPAASAAETMEQMLQYGENAGANRVGQVTSVSQLTDVKPSDWAFQALQSLVERYGCIVGYPDRTYRGNRALTRYEFAAGLNSCMDKVKELIDASTNGLMHCANCSRNLLTNWSSYAVKSMALNPAPVALRASSSRPRRNSAVKSC
jgi:hypothetical protein